MRLTSGVVAVLAAVVLSACGASTPDTVDTTVDTASVDSSQSTDPTTSDSASDSTTASSSAPSTTEVGSTPATKVSHTVKTLNSLDGAVDVVERDPADGFVYVVSRNGFVERWRNDGTRIDRVLDVSAATTGEGERGLLGLAFRRGSTGAWAAYMNMTDTDGTTLIVRHGVTSAGDIDETGTVILEIDQPYANHNGGDLRFGPDGMLYIATGDGGSAGDPERFAKNLSSLLGKILRIDPSANGYRVPDDNPYVGVAGARPEIWSIGLRNPWRFTITANGDMWIADVGQNEVEEVSVARASGTGVGGRRADFGWSAWEGTRRYNSDVAAAPHLAPVVEYTHDKGRCSVSGGAVATSVTNPGRDGWFFYGDYCSGEVWSAHVPAAGKVTVERVATDVGDITSVRATSRAMWVTTMDGDVHVISTAVS